MLIVRNIHAILGLNISNLTRMKNLKLILLVSLFLTVNLCVFAQINEVKGKVMVFDSIPVVNANVMVYSSKLKVTTNHEGVFQCECQIKDKIIVTAEGFSKKTLRVKKNKQVGLVVDLKLAKLSEAKDIAIEKGHILMVEQFEELARKFSGTKDYSKYTSVMDIIRNEFPTLQIVNGEIIIRGPSSLLGSSAAQIEIDGVILDYSAMESLSPTNIANIKVVKGSDTAIYGVRGGTGVISITTKNGDSK